SSRCSSGCPVAPFSGAGAAPSALCAGGEAERRGGRAATPERYRPTGPRLGLSAPSCPRVLGAALSRHLVGASNMTEMPYRRLGRSGLQVSVLSFGSWVPFGDQIDTKLARECLSAARDAGVNFFDNAEAYAGGQSEQIMGDAIAELGWERHEYVISTKVFWGIHEGVVNMKNTLNRKY